MLCSSALTSKKREATVLHLMPNFLFQIYIEQITIGRIFEKNELLSIQFSKCHPPGKRPQVSLLPHEKQCVVYVILLLFVSLHLISKAKFQQAVVTENYDFSVCVLQTQKDVYYTHVYKKNLYKHL